MDTATTHAVTASRWRRLAGMGLMEVGYRGRQEGAKWLDRLRSAADAATPEGTLARHAPGFADPDAALSAIRRTFDDRFFAGVNEATAAIIRDGHRAYVDAITTEAEALLGHRFDLLGYRGLSFGDPIDWHLDPLLSRRTDLVHWSRIDALDAARVGDSKVVWELSRHQWVVRLAQAYVLSGDRRYADAALSAIRSWIAANPVGLGINWASSLEVAFRLISWTWVIALLRHSALLAGDTLTIMLASVHAHATHVLRYLSQYYSPNTHLTGEALGLFYAGTLFPQFRAAARWCDAGADTLNAQVDQQISSDGVYFEQSTCYQRYTADFYLHYVLLARRARRAVPARVVQRLESVIDFLETVRRPDGSLPGIGDADGGWLMPLARRSAGDPGTTIERNAPDAIWLFGSDATPTAPRPQRSETTLYRHGGYAVLRDSRDRDAHQMIVDIGPLGCHVSSGHGHADLLSIQCSVFGDNCLVDAGTYTYTGAPEWRDYFRSSAAHSTVMIDGRSQARPAGPFRWHSRPRVVLRDFRSTPHLDLVDAEHRAYGPVVHRRRVAWVKPHFWVVIDDLTGGERHDVEVTFQFDDIPVELTGTTARATTVRRRALWVMPFSSAPLEADIRTGDTNPIRGWISMDYGQRRAAPALVYRSHAPLPVRIVTVLYPQRSADVRPEIDATSADGLPVSIYAPAVGRALHFTDSIVTLE